MSSYRYSSDANADIEEIALYIFNLNPAAGDLREELANLCFHFLQFHVLDFSGGVENH